MYTKPHFYLHMKPHSVDLTCMLKSTQTHIYLKTPQIHAYFTHRFHNVLAVGMPYRFGSNVGGKGQSQPFAICSTRVAFTPITGNLSTAILLFTQTLQKCSRSGLSSLSGHNFHHPHSHKHTHCICSHRNDGLMVHMQSKPFAPWPAHCCNNTHTTTLTSQPCLCFKRRLCVCVCCKLPSNFPLMCCSSQRLGILNTIPYFHIWNLSQLYNCHSSWWKIYIWVHFPHKTVATSQ